MNDETTAQDEAHIIETPEQPAQEVQEAPVQPKTDSIKLLAQRNAAKAEAATEKARADAAEARAKELEEKANKADTLEEQLVKTEVEKEEKQLKDTFYSEQPQAKELESLIDAKVAEGHSYEDAFLIVAAKNKPELLVEEAVMNKINGGAKMTGVAQPVSNPKIPQTPEDLSKMSDKDILARQNSMAATERKSQGFAN